MQAWSCEQCKPDVRKECMKALLRRDNDKAGYYADGKFALPKCENRIARPYGARTVTNMGRVQEVIDAAEAPLSTMEIMTQCLRKGLSEDMVRSALENLRRDGRVYSRQERSSQGPWFYYSKPLDGFELVPTKTHETVKRVAEARAKGLSITASAKELGVSTATVIKYTSLARRFGLLP